MTYKLIQNRFPTGAALVLAVTASVYADEAASPQPAAQPNAVESFFKGKIPEAFAKGKFNLNARLRYEYADETGVAAITDPSHAFTLRTRFGFTTAPVYGFQGMIEGENVTVLGPEGNYNAAGSNGKGYKPPVADPPTTELNQAWLSYSYKDMVTIKGGRERIVLDNVRFIGDVGWRQNMQTFDAVSATVNPVKDVSLFYGYIGRVHRIFGNVPGLPAGFTDFDSHSHLINLSYSACKYAHLTGYAYLLDLKNAAGAANSCATYGGSLTGTAPVTDKLSLNYRAEFAEQTDYADSPLNYTADYYHFELSGSVKPFLFGASYEVLGSDGGTTSFRTPLATLHAWNGWADVFLNTPASGLHDISAFAQVMLPKNVPLRFVYHKFDADSGSGDFGQEFDVVASHKFGKNWTALVKYAYYNGKDAAPPSLPVPNVDIQKFWAQIEFNY